MINFNKNGDSLVPVIVQDNSTLTVLMLGYMNAEAYQKSVDQGRVTFFSRTKGRLWTKGETSGNFLNIVSIKEDCDQDALLIRVIADGPTCHNGTNSCFGFENENEGFIGALQHLIQQRHREMPQGSYTTQLFEKGVNKIAQKVGEEAVETVIEAIADNNEAMIYEASDLIYHLLVLLENQGLSLTDIENELARRHK